MERNKIKVGQRVKLKENYCGCDLCKRMEDGANVIGIKTKRARLECDAGLVEIYPIEFLTLVDNDYQEIEDNYDI